MKLVVSVGNTNIRAAVGDKSLTRQTAFPLDGDAARITADIKRGLGDVWPHISAMVSVAPEAAVRVSEAICRVTGTPPKRIDIRRCGLDISGYESTLGEDRALCCAYALLKCPPPLVVIDCGTATTVNTVGAGGIFLGGAILTGLQTGLDALNQHTAQLPRVTAVDEANTPLLGTNTIDGLRAGAVIGTACALEGFIARIKSHLNTEPTVFVTGGHAPAILPHCNFTYQHEPDLLLNAMLAFFPKQ
jgi:type III pantothenate kinase